MQNICFDKEWDMVHFSEERRQFSDYSLNNDIFDNYLFGCDWLSGNYLDSDVKGLFDFLESCSSLLKFNRWTKIDRGLYNYSDRYILDGKFSFQIAFNSLPNSPLEANLFCNNPGIFITISGDGLRYLRSLGSNPENSPFQKLFVFLRKKEFHCTRIDCYCDVLDKNNKVVPGLTKCWRNFMRPRVGSPTLSTGYHRINKNFGMIPVYQDGLDKPTYNLYLGNHGSNLGMFRCYNKFVEVQEGRLASISEELLNAYGVTDYWYRMEYELKSQASLCFNAVVDVALENNFNLDFRSLFFYCASLFFSPVKASLGHNTPSPLPFWDEFFRTVGRNIYFVQLNHLPYVRQDLNRLVNYLEHNGAFFYAQFQALRSLSSVERSAAFDRYRKRFFDNPKYNLLRDDLSFYGIY